MNIEVSNIAKSFGKKKVLENVSFTAKSGECIGILGGNGSGKSTLLSILAGVQRADKGEFLLDGKNLFKDTSLRSKLVGYVPQGTPLIEELSAKDNLLLWYSSKKLKKELEDGVLKMLGIDEFIKVSVSKMSGGMKKRLSIGCAIYSNPPVILLDEPMSALDIACKHKIFEYLSRYKKAGGIIILVTHDLYELELCDRCYIIKDGQANPYEFNGNVSELLEKI